VSDRSLYTAFGASLLIHLMLLPAASVKLQNKRSVPITIPIKLVYTLAVEEVEELESLSHKPLPKPVAEKITAPKLLSKPGISKTRLSPTTRDVDEEIKQKEKRAERLPPLASLSSESDSIKGGGELGEIQGGAVGPESLFDKGNVAVVGESSLESGGSKHGSSGLDRGARGDAVGQGQLGLGQATDSLARPLGGYQVKPHYPESARRAGAQGITLLKVRVLENGKVGEIHIEKSAGHTDLDRAAVEAVKRWLFEPARMGKVALAVWVLLPVKFELE
jgi:TonB family protein